MKFLICDDRDNDPKDSEFTYTHHFNDEDFHYHYVNDDPWFCNSEPEKKTFLSDIEDLSSVTKNYFENAFE